MRTLGKLPLIKRHTFENPGGGLMESRNKLFDTFQIVGFAASTIVAIALVVAQVDPAQSTVIGLLLAVFTQLFDLQLRHSSSEERLLQASNLSKSLYRDPELQSQIQHIVEDYYSIHNGWLDLYKTRAQHMLSECHRVLRSMALGTMEPPAGSQFTLYANGLKLAQTSIKQVTDYAAIKDAVQGLRGWFTRAWEETAARGVQTSMILVLSRQDLKDMLSQTETVPTPVGTYIAISGELPPELDENYLIVDDRVISFSERRADGTLGERMISIVPIEVERMVKRYDQSLRYARKAEDVIAEARKE
jgi:hypothetical protein